MTDRPILFSGPMAQAILEGRKTQTRRVITKKYLPYDENRPCHCPYGVPGDRLWVRETWAIVEPYPSDDSDIADKLGLPLLPLSEGLIPYWQKRVMYRAGLPQRVQPCEMIERGSADKLWRPSIHMPRWASRLTLEITGVRVQRLQEISEEDAQAEGVTASEFIQWACLLASQFKTEPLHWIETPEGSSDEDYCFDCARKKLADIVAKRGNSDDCFVDGGWPGHEADGPRFCETCGVALEVCLTDYAVGEEFSHFKQYREGYGPSGAWALTQLAEAVHGTDREKEFSPIGFRWLWDSINAKRGVGWDTNPWVWAITFKQVSA